MLISWVGTCGFYGCPSTAQIQAFRPSEGSRVLDRSGKLIGRLSYVRRINVPVNTVPRSVRAAFIATEDRRFYYHGGVDWRSAGRALVRNLSEIGVREGFSTITMQVVRNAFLPHLSSERSLRRKLIELELARRLERTLTKQQILETYLNVIYLGNGTYGVEAASRDLFGKSVGRLSLAEAATLAGLAQGSVALRASAASGPSAGTARPGAVAHGAGGLHHARARRARPAGAAPAGSGGMAPPAGSIVRARPRSRGSRFGARRRRRNRGRPRRSLDARRRSPASGRARNQDTGRRPSSAQAARSGSKAEIEGAVVALDPRTGEIRALVGGRRSVRRGFNRALGARRQPGSAFKPFVYAAALAAGYSPATILDDSPVEIEDAGRIWRPENFGGEYGGPLTLRRALMRSANAATVRLSQAVGEKRVAALARRVRHPEPNDAVPALALGALEVTPLELVAAYAPFANGGMRVQPSPREPDRGGRRHRALAGAPAQAGGARPRDAFQITSMLQSVVDGGTGRVLREMGVRGPVAGKTGTTNNGADVWFIGYTPTWWPASGSATTRPGRSPPMPPAAASPRRHGRHST